ncbi:MAG TPA: hypothetical protein VGF84_02900 [Micromonosporaceae bacterium]|jgi:hypothetical protein
MGLFDGIRAVKAMADDAFASVPRWARIVRIGRRVGPLTAFDLEIHHGTNPPVVVSTMSWVPRSVSPMVGQDVAYRMSIGDDSTHYEIIWDRPPQYGTPRPQ